MSLRSTRKRSYVWEHFRISEENNCEAICNYCGIYVRRGTTIRTFSTSPLIGHLRRCKQNPIFKDPDLIKKFCPSRRGARSREPNINATILIDNLPFDHSVDEDGYASQQLVHTPTQSGHTTDDSVSHMPSLVRMVDSNFTPTRTSKNSEHYVASDSRCDVIDDVICSKRMDLIHSGSVMHILYQQHRSGSFCDLSLIVTHKTSTTTIALNDSIHASTRKSGRKTFKAHSAVLAALSSKIKALIEMGSSTIEMKDVTSFGLRSLLEIVYTGKLKLSSVLRLHQAHQIWKAASDLGIAYVQDYLVNEHPQVANWVTERRESSSETHDDNDLRDLCGASLVDDTVSVEQIIGEIAEQEKTEPEPVKTGEYLQEND